MLDALLKGKLSRDQENMEDILTSTVFGGMRYAGAIPGLLRWLAEARTLDNDRPLATLAPDVRVTFEFWPKWAEAEGNGCEPDVVLEISGRESRHWLVLIEAKYRYGKSSEGDPTIGKRYDQLAREWDNLIRKAEKANSTPVLIYLTADFTMPRHELSASVEDFHRFQHGARAVPVICWLSWRLLPQLFRNDPNAVLKDLARLAIRLNLRFFERVDTVVSPENIEWHFTMDRTVEDHGERFDWDIYCLTELLTWSFVR